MLESHSNFSHFLLASYAGIAKLKSSTGATSNVPATVPAPVPAPPQQTVLTRPSTTGKTNVPNRTNNFQQQPPRGNGNYYPGNPRNNQWNDNQQQDQNSGRRSGANLAGVPDEQQVFVGSLPLDFTREDLIDCFKQFGTVLDAKIHTPTYDYKKVRPGQISLENLHFENFLSL